MPKSNLHPPKVVKTKNGWEPLYWSERYKCYFVEPGFASSTKTEAKKQIPEINKLKLLIKKG